MKTLFTFHRASDDYVNPGDFDHACADEANRRRLVTDLLSVAGRLRRVLRLVAVLVLATAALLAWLLAR